MFFLMADYVKLKQKNPITVKEKDCVSALSANFNAASNLKQSLYKTVHPLAHFCWLMYKPTEPYLTEQAV